MKKHGSGIVFICCFAILLFLYFAWPYLFGLLIVSDPEYFLLERSCSPDGEYVLNAYRVNTGATNDYSVEVYLVDGDDENLIYDAYHEYEVDIVWKSDCVVEINGQNLDLSKNEKYDWRKNTENG